MVKFVRLKNGEDVMIFDLQDIISTIEAHMGEEMATTLQEYLEEQESEYFKESCEEYERLYSEMDYAFTCFKNDIEDIMEHTDKLADMKKRLKTLIKES